MEQYPDSEQAHRNLFGYEDAPALTSAPDMPNRASAWQLYDQLIDGIPEDITVLDYVLGVNWSFVQAESGAGVSYTARDGATRSHGGDYRGRTLREVASLARSWCFEEATIGVAALNAWYGQMPLLQELNAIFDEGVPDAAEQTDTREVSARRRSRSTEAFSYYEPEMVRFGELNGRRANVVVVGHFPHVEKIMEYANLTVLERNCKNAVDTPDPACEYVMPSADFAFLTGVTLINKTMPRLLQLCDSARVAIVGPSAVASPVMFDYGVDAIAGRCVVDPEHARFSAASGDRFGDSLHSFIVKSF